VHPQVLRRQAADLAARSRRSSSPRRPPGRRWASAVHGSPKRTRQPWPPGSISATTGCTRIFSPRAIFDGASSVDAGTPKKGAKAVSLRPKSMSGRLKKAMPSLADGAHQGQRALS
jgi:hypothetical protein